MRVDACTMATATGHADVVQMLSQHPGTSAPSPPTGYKFEPARAPAEATVVARVDCSTLARDRSSWDAAFATSSPLLVDRLGEPWSAALRMERRGEHFHARQGASRGRQPSAWSHLLISAHAGAIAP